MDLNQAKQKLAELKKSKPIEPVKPQLIYEDVTAEALAYELHKGLKNIGLVSDEGATILNGRAAKGIPLYNKMWGGQSFSVARKTMPSFMVQGARLTFSVMIQFVVIQKYMRTKGDESTSIGFFARFLVCNPLSTQGSRFINPMEVM